jgi:hypothetical protein
MWDSIVNKGTWNFSTEARVAIICLLATRTLGIRYVSNDIVQDNEIITPYDHRKSYFYFYDKNIHHPGDSATPASPQRTETRRRAQYVDRISSLLDANSSTQLQVNCIGVESQSKQWWYFLDKENSANVRMVQGKPFLRGFTTNGMITRMGGTLPGQVIMPCHEMMWS